MKHHTGATFFSSLFIVITFLLCFLSSVNSCGIRTHIEIGHRANFFFSSKNKYKRIFEKHQDAFQAGLPFPDWGFACAEGDTAEDTHWPPFINFFIKFVQQNYLQNLTVTEWRAGVADSRQEEVEKLIAFIFGISSHSIADIMWHGLADLRVGFIDVDAALHFNHSYPKAHANADPGGDVVTAFSMDSRFLVDKWWVPIGALEQVYREYYHGMTNVTAATLEKGALLLYLGGIAERISQHLYILFAGKSPFLVEQLEHFFDGGLDDMAIRTQWDWSNVIEALETNATYSPVIYNLQLTDEQLSLKDDSTSALKTLVEELITDSEGAFKPVITRLPNGAVQFSMTGDLEQLISSVEQRIQSREAMKVHKKPIESQPVINQSPIPVTTVISEANAIFTINRNYTYTGFSLATIKGNSKLGTFDRLLVGSPGYSSDDSAMIGSISVLKYSVDKKAFEEQIKLTESDRNDRFGWSVISLDWNQDGFDDILVSAPTTGLAEHQYWPKGEIRVYLALDELNFSLTPNYIIYADGPNTTHLGTNLFKADVNQDGFDDLIIGNPYWTSQDDHQKGMVSIFLSKNQRGSQTLHCVQDADWVLFGATPYEWFGHAMAVTHHFDEVVLIVGAPQYRLSPQLQAVGKIYAFTFQVDKKSQRITHAKLTFSITGAEDKARLGFALGCTVLTNRRSVLAVGAPTSSKSGHLHAGMIFLVDSIGLTGDHFLNGTLQGHVVSKIYGNQMFSRLGSVIHFFKLASDNVEDSLVIGQPYHDNQLHQSVDNGIVYILSKLPFYHNANDIRTVASSVVEFKEAFAKFGSSLALGNFNDDLQLIVSAPNNNLNNRVQGTVFQLKM